MTNAGSDDCRSRPATARLRLPTRIALLFLLSATALDAQSTDRARVESQARRANERLVALQREADALASEQRSLLVDLRRLEVERDLRAEQLTQIQNDALTLAQELSNTANQIDGLEDETTATRPVLEARMTEIYKLGGAGYVRLLFNVSDLKEFGRAYRMVAAVAAIDRQRVERHKRSLEQLRAAYKTLEQKRTEMAKLQHAAQAARVATERAATARAQLVAQIDRRRDLTAELASELQSAQIKLQQTLAAINAGVPRASTEGSALPIRPFRGVLEWPVIGRLLTPFGRRTPGASTTPGQSGVQFAAAEGSAVRAVHDGTVAYSGPFTGYGSLVIVDHGGQTFSLYGQLAAPQVERGATVERGQTIGTAGRILAGIPGMYFEMRVDGKPIDPLEWLKKRP
ncbi:MAG TPA: peptidoglycan DD-metalloendopeptidase family protein [Vicinamibacterales bacterium]|nr:peptidoglycan DD-metalloendopeptidase family protein [Vicinamibacterales bacterium]